VKVPARQESRRLNYLAALLACCGISAGSAAAAGDRLAWTGGVTQLEGSAGGGLVPWALIGGLGSADQVGASAFATNVRTQQFTLRAAGLAVGIDDRLELSYARQWFDASKVLPGTTLGQDILGAKVRLVGDAVFDENPVLPQVAVGAQFKQTRDFAGVPRAVGATRASGIDVYLALTKVFLGGISGHTVLIDLTLRRSDANQLGLLGFGGPIGAPWRPEASAAFWLRDELLVSAEYRSKRSALPGLSENAARDVFLAYGPIKQVSFVAAWADLGRIAGTQAQRGLYLSVSLAY
jgi:hypothetical protein